MIHLMRGFLKGGGFFIIFILLLVLWVSSNSLAEMIPTTTIRVRVVSKDSKVIGSGVGGALVRIKNMETGAILAQGIQEGGTGDTDRIMIQPRRRGEIIYGTGGAAYFQADLALAHPTQVEIYTEAPLKYPQAIQKGSKTLTLIPGMSILGEGVIIELDGLIVNILEPSPKEAQRREREVTVRAEVRML
jgi:hypothetical protein